jgi:murein DD-endopeptidase MepM/ murein hydrolase activator NlpD
MLGAGVVALGAGAALDDPGTDAAAPVDQASARDTFADRASRADDRAAAMTESWMLPVHNYDLAKPTRWDNKQHGVTLAVAEGTSYHAVHAGTVVLAGWNSGYGYAVIVDHGDGLQTLYGHSSQVRVEVGQHVEAGDELGLVGLTGYAAGPALRLEVHQNGVALDTMSFFADRGVDFRLELEAMLPES